MTEGNNECKFPFKYNDEMYDACTTVDNEDVFWCATGVAEDKTYTTYGNCVNNQQCSDAGG